MSSAERLSLTPRNLLREIKTSGYHGEMQIPDIANKLGNPGHHNGMFDGDSRLDGTIRTDEGIEYTDATNYWMTESIDASWLTGDRRLMEKLGKLTIEAPTVSEFATPEYAGFLAMMHRFWPDAAHIFCYNAGTLATDAAAKAMVAQKMIEYHFAPEDMKIAALTHAFHGRAGWGLELTETTAKTQDWQTGRAIRIPSPAIVFHDNGDIDEDATSWQVARSLDALEKAFQKSAKVAGIMLEYPFQAEGGAILLAPEFLKGAREICDTHRRFLAIDAVQMAGKGYPFPVDALEVADYVTFGKFFRVCGVMALDPTKRGFSLDHMAIPGKYGGTWAGRLADMVAAQAIVSVIKKNNLWENGRQMANRMYQGLRELAIEEMGIIKPRISGAYVGFDFATREGRDWFVARAREDHHVLFLPAGETAIRWSPRLDTTADQVDHLLGVTGSILW